MGEISEYSKSVTPKVEQPGGAGSQYYYQNASSFKPADTSAAESAVNEAMTELVTGFTEDVNKFSSVIESMADNFGTKFITINEKRLGFVDQDAFLALTNRGKVAIEDAQTAATEFFGKCNSGNSSINSWLTSLTSNYNTYKHWKDKYDNLCAKTDPTSNDEVEKDRCLQMLSKYKELPNEPITYGEWIKG